MTSGGFPKKEIADVLFIKLPFLSSDIEKQLLVLTIENKLYRHQDEACLMC